MPKNKNFLETRRLGFRIWTSDDLDLAIGLWGDYEVTKLFDGLQHPSYPLTKESYARLEKNNLDYGDFST